VRFPPEPLLESRVVRDMRGQDLESDHPVGNGVMCPEDLAHPAPAQQFQQLVVPERRHIQRLLLGAFEPSIDVEC
jgi:hypothetical protein